MSEYSGVNSLNPYQQSILENFREITALTEDNLCIEILQENDWDLQMAVDAYVQGGARQRNTFTSASSSLSSSSSSFVSSSTANSTRIESSRSTEQTFFDRLFSPLRWLFQTVPVSLTPEADTRKFIAEFDATYGSEHLDFVNSSYINAVSSAFRSSKFLLVYLHSPLHDDTNRFCRLILTRTIYVFYS
jgi:hypothetical protein